MIGVFDSGLGGLTILKEFLRILPEYNYVYLGDNARAPYGSKSQVVIYNYTREAVDFLFKRGCELIIVACNSSSAKALRKIQREYLPEAYPGKRVLGVIIPVSEVAANSKKIVNIGLIGTKATIESETYEKELNKINPGLKIYKKACPLLVPLVEEGLVNKAETKRILNKYLKPLKDKKIDTLILGCTHYPILIKEIRAVMGKNINVLDSPKIVAEKLRDYLRQHPEIEKRLKKNSDTIFYTTDEVEKFREMGEKFLGQAIKNIKRAEL